MAIRYNIKTVKSIFILFFLIIFSVFLVTSALAQDQEPVGGESYDNYIKRVNPSTTGLGNAFNTNTGSPLDAVAVQGAGFNNTATFKSIIGQVITMVLSFMGIIFLVLAIYGGYNWMTARGDEQKVEKAKQTITNAIIGLIVVLAAYVISWSVVNVVGSKVFK